MGAKKISFVFNEVLDIPLEEYINLIVFMDMGVKIFLSHASPV
jgi:hypothetical protein